MGSALTFTLAVACPPFAEAVMVAVPPATAVPGIETLVLLVEAVEVRLDH